MLTTFHIRKFDYVLVLASLALTSFGILAIHSARPELVGRQLMGLGIGLIAMIVISALDYKTILRYYYVWYAIALVFLLWVLLFGLQVNGARRWIVFGPITFQPSEASKLLLILFYSKFIMKMKEKVNSLVLLLISMALALPPLLMILKEPDLSTTLMVSLIIACLLFAGGLDYKLIGGILAVMLPAAGGLLFAVVNLSAVFPDYQRNRILAWLNPEAYATSYAYQTMQSIRAIGSGQLFGKWSNPNPSSSLLDSGFLSESQTDFIFSVIGEEYGFIGTCLVLVLLTAIAVRCFMIGGQARKMSGRLIACGVGSWIGFQGMLNIGVAVGMVPNTGIPLPFVSYGLTSLVSLFAGIGFVLNVRMQTGKQA